MAQAKRPPVGINPAIPIPVQRELRKVASFAFDAQDNANSALTGLQGKVSKSKADLLEVSSFVSKQVQADGQYPINLTGLTNGFTGTINFAGGFTVNGTTFHNLEFQSGLLTGVS